MQFSTQSPRRALALLLLIPLLTTASCRENRSIVKKTTTIPLTFRAPEATAKNRLIAHDVLAAAGRAHGACGLDPREFQESLNELQSVAAGTDFEEMTKTYTEAARICHDAKFRPKKFTSSEEQFRSRRDASKTSARVETVTTPGAVVVNAEGSYEASTDSSSAKGLVETFENAESLLASRETIAALQNLEDRVYENLISTLKTAGYETFRRTDLVGYWMWDWKEGGVPKGKIKFSLKEDGRMEAKLYDSPELADWGSGDWSFNGGQLKVEMRRVGKVGVPGSVEHYVKWFDHRVDYVTKDEVLLERGHVLTGTSEW